MLLMQKMNPDAKLFKRKSEADSGYDIWGLFDKPIVVHEPHTVIMVKTGIKTAFPKEYTGEIKERGSTGSLNIQVRAGVMDSCYRGEWIIMLNNGNDYPVFYIKGEKESEEFYESATSLTNLYKESYALANGGADEVFTLTKNKIFWQDKIIAALYPQGTAIAQVVFPLIGNLKAEEVSELDQTERGEGMLGSSGH